MVALQFSPDIAVISTGNQLQRTLFNADESTENKYVIFENVYLADTSQWTNGVGFGFNVILQMVLIRLMFVLIVILVCPIKQPLVILIYLAGVVKEF